MNFLKNTIALLGFSVVFAFRHSPFYKLLLLLEPSYFIGRASNYIIDRANSQIAFELSLRKKIRSNEWNYDHIKNKYLIQTFLDNYKYICLFNVSVFNKWWHPKQYKIATHLFRNYAELACVLPDISPALIENMEFPFADTMEMFNTQFDELLKECGYEL